MDLERLPVIIGASEVCERWSSAGRAREPLSLMCDVICAADRFGAAAKADTLDVVNSVSWRYRDLPAQLAERLAIRPRRMSLGPIGGETPIALLDAAAARIRAGESELGIIAGAEALHSVTRARQAGERLPWTPLAPPKADREEIEGYVNPTAARYGAARPIQVYPLFENAAVHAWGQTPAEGVAESAALWAELSDIAATRACAWSKRRFSAAEIAAASAENRMVCAPYRKLMVANPNVNQGAALIVASAAMARRLGVTEDLWVHVWPGVARNEPRNFLERADFVSCPSQRFVLARLLEQIGEAPGRQEIYSCFPIVQKLARRQLGARVMSVAGGLSFFGAPLNNYMTHAAVAMVEAVLGGANTGLLYGQGGFLTKHHGVVLARTPFPAPGFVGVEREPATARARVRFLETYAGQATLETTTVKYDRDNCAVQGIVIARTPDGARVIASVSAGESLALATLTGDRSPVGAQGEIRGCADGLLSWTFA